VYILVKVIKECVLREFNDGATDAYHENNTSEYANNSFEGKCTNNELPIEAELS
jgi:hypothetical protein